MTLNKTEAYLAIGCPAVLLSSFNKEVAVGMYQISSLGSQTSLMSGRQLTCIVSESRFSPHRAGVCCVNGSVTSSMFIRNTLLNPKHCYLSQQ